MTAMVQQFGITIAFNTWGFHTQSNCTSSWNFSFKKKFWKNSQGRQGYAIRTIRFFSNFKSAAARPSGTRSFTKPLIFWIFCEPVHWSQQMFWTQWIDLVYSDCFSATAGLQKKGPLQYRLAHLFILSMNVRKNWFFCKEEEEEGLTIIF